MAVRDESRNAPFLQSFARLCGRIDHAMDIDDCIRDQAMLKGHGLAIAADQIHFGMGHTAGLDRVFNRRFLAEKLRDRFGPVFAAQKKEREP